MTMTLDNPQLLKPYADITSTRPMDYGIDDAVEIKYPGMGGIE